MLGIPPALDTDAEDVVWALQTADALWKRAERIDAVVWLRRAAQAAGEANDDDRALTLARNAAELAEKMAREVSPVSEIAETTGAFGVDELLGQDVPDGAPTDLGDASGGDDEHEEVDVDELSISDGVAAAYRDAAPAPSPEPTPTPIQAGSERRRLSSPRPPAPSPLPPPPQSDLGHVRTAAEAHAGMLDPWAEAEAPTGVHDAPVPGAAAQAPARFDMDEVVTSAPHVAPPPADTPKVRPPPQVPPLTRLARGAPPRPAPPPLKVESLPAGAVDEADDVIDRPTPSGPPQSTDPIESADAPTPVAAPVAEAPVPKRPAPSPRPGAPSPRARAAAPAKLVPKAPAHSPVAPPPTTVTPQVASPNPGPVAAPAASTPVREPSLVDLSQVEALGDLPDDSRHAFERVARIEDLAREDEVSGFALAFVLEGSVDVAATIIDAPAHRLEAGAVLRSRGTIDHVAPVRLLVASPRARVATWDERAVAEAFRTCPWVENELRVAGDRIQALVGLTMGPLGERLDPNLRADVTNRLQLRTLGEHEIFTKRGAPSPGLLVVGAGELELVDQEGIPTGAVVRAGEFLFPSEVLRAAPVPFTVRAAKGGALVLLAERRIAQELLVTCPPLLEIFAGG